MVQKVTLLLGTSFFAHLDFILTNDPALQVQTNTLAVNFISKIVINRHYYLNNYACACFFIVLSCFGQMLLPCKFKLSYNSTL